MCRVVDPKKAYSKVDAPKHTLEQVRLALASAGDGNLPCELPAVVVIRKALGTMPIALVTA